MSLFQKLFKKKKINKNAINYIGNSKIIIVKEDGTKVINPETINGLFIGFGGTDNLIELHEPFRLTNTSIMIESRGKHSIKIGKGFTCNGASFIIGSEDSEITIGDDCMFSWGITVTPNDFHVIFDKKTGKLLNKGGRIVIKDHVWVGMNVTILKNSVIPKNCVVGANSVVSGKFNQGNAILAGNPAKVIRNDIEWTRESYDRYIKNDPMTKKRII